MMARKIECIDRAYVRQIVSELADEWREAGGNGSCYGVKSDTGLLLEDVLTQLGYSETEIKDAVR